MAPVCVITTPSKTTEIDDIEEAWSVIARAHMASKIPPFYLAVIGTRSRNALEDDIKLNHRLDEKFASAEYLAMRLILVSGAAHQGGDRFARAYARKNKIPLIEFPARWDDLSHPDATIKQNQWGKSYDAKAGFRRNVYVAHLADAILALGTNGLPGGTEDTIARFKTIHPDGKIEII